MSLTSTDSEPSASLVLEYRLTEDDIHHYCLAGRPRKCWRSCRHRKVALLILSALGLFLVGVCYHARGIRAGGLAIGTTLGIVAAFVWTRQARIDGHLCRLAGQMGLPEDFRLVVSAEGIVEEPAADSGDPGRSFGWSEVIAIDRIDRLTVLRLRHGGCVLFVPDRVFSTPEAREGFARSIRAWRKAASR
jgi:hypothetical protein